MTETNEYPEIKFSEIFRSIQGEGFKTGHPCLWLRFFLCSLQCNGFGQKDPTDSSTWDKQWEQIPLKDAERLEDLPVLTKGCDSGYSWAKRFEHLQRTAQAPEIIDELAGMLPEYEVWSGPSYDFDMIFTGGEPMMKKAQEGIASIVNLWAERVKDTHEQFKEDGKIRGPVTISFETNGTQAFMGVLLEAFEHYNRVLQQYAGHPLSIILNYSPKLFTVSGEPAKKAIKPDKIVKNVQMLADYGIVPEFVLKFVLSPEQRAWDELEEVIDKISYAAESNVRRAVWIMPVSSTMEEQATYGRAVAEEAIERGYKVAARIQTLLFDNTMGV